LGRVRGQGYRGRFRARATARVRVRVGRWPHRAGEAYVAAAPNVHPPQP